MTWAEITALALSGLWLLLTALLPRMAGSRRPVGVWVLIVIGVPILGWLTALWGPGAGVLAFALGLIALGRCTARDRSTVQPGE